MADVACTRTDPHSQHRGCPGIVDQATGERLWSESTALPGDIPDDPPGWPGEQWPTTTG